MMKSTTPVFVAPPRADFSCCHDIITINEMMRLDRCCIKCQCAFNIFCVFKDICFKQAFPHCTAHVDFDFIPQTFGSALTALTSYSTAYRPNGLCCFRAKRRIQGCCIYYHRDYHLSLGVGKNLAL